MQNIKKILLIIIIFLTSFLFYSCNAYEYKLVYEDDFFIEYNELFTKAYCAGYLAYPDSISDINVPKAYKNAAIKSLGSSDNGFYVRLKLPTYQNDSVIMKTEADLEEYQNNEAFNLNIINCNLIIDENIEEIYSFNKVLYITKALIGSTTNGYILRYYVICSEDNNKFYSIDGKLYNKNSNSLVEQIPYIG